jgi:hypothetical protein
MVVAALSLLVLVAPATAAEARTANFRVVADDLGIARAVALRAEELRLVIATDWLGAELAPWSLPCVIHVNTAKRPAQGETTFRLLEGRVTDWNIRLQGDEHRLLSSLVPHEVAHTVFISHFRRPAPRWADEGAALLAEETAVRQQLWSLESAKFTEGEGPSLRRLLHATEYPTASNDLRTFYVQSASLTEFLVSAGKPHFLKFVAAGVESGWDRAVRDYYGFSNVEALEASWSAWVRDHRPKIEVHPGRLLAVCLDPGVTTQTLLTGGPAAAIPAAAAVGAE